MWEILEYFAMSWDAYRDSLVGSGHCAYAAVVGVEDGRVWSQSPGMKVSGGPLILGHQIHHDHPLQKIRSGEM